MPTARVPVRSGPGPALRRAVAVLVAVSLAVAVAVGGGPPAGGEPGPDAGTATAIPQPTGGQPTDYQLVAERRAVPDLSFVPGTAGPAELDAVEAVARSAYDSLVAMWAGVFGGPTVVNVRLIRPGEPLQVSACNPGTPVNVPQTAFYCTIDDTIWINDLLLVGFGRRFGPFAVSTVVAHEYAHKLQREAGLFAVARAVVDIELQADCLAGTWSRTRAEVGLLSEADVAAAVAAVAAVGDTELTDPNHHGTPERRQAAWMRGLSGQDCPLGGI